MSRSTSRRLALSFDEERLLVSTFYVGYFGFGFVLHLDKPVFFFALLGIIHLAHFAISSVFGVIFRFVSNGAFFKHSWGRRRGRVNLVFVFNMAVVSLTIVGSFVGVFRVIF